MTEKAEPKRQTIVLPRAEWDALLGDVRKLVRADEQLLSAYGQLLDSYQELLRKREGLRGREGRPRRGFRSLFRRRQAPQTAVYMERVAGAMCLHCGADLEVNDKFCRICGKGAQAP